MKVTMMLVGGVVSPVQQCASAFGVVGGGMEKEKMARQWE